MTLKPVKTSVRARYPMLYWLTFVNLVGLPSFISFDGSGRTHNNGLFNLTSISRMSLVFITVYILAVVLLLDRKPIFGRRLNVYMLPWLILLGLNTVSIVFQVPGHLTPPLATDLPLCLFRLGEWFLGFVLILILYSRVPREEGLRLMVDLIGQTSWVAIVMVWIMVPIAPGLAFGATDDSGSLHLLGGQFYGPTDLALHAGCAFFYSLFFIRGAHTRWAACLVALVTLEMTRSRSQLLGFLFALACYVLFYYRRPGMRVLALGTLLIAGVVALPFSGSLVDYLARGQGLRGLQSLDDRTMVWQASWDAIQGHPIMGHGFLIGARNAIRDHWIYSHWVPPHAHNDILQAMLQTGALGGLAMLYIYAWQIRRCILNARLGPQHLLLLLVVVQLSITSLTSPVLSVQYASLGGIFFLCWIGSADEPPLTKEKRVSVLARSWREPKPVIFAEVSRRLSLRVDEFP